MSTEFYGLDGQPITMEEWGDLAKSGERIIEQTTLPNGAWVSTVHLGIDHGWGEGPPIIFESMVFARAEDVSDDLDQQRYATLEEARSGHALLVTKWSHVPLHDAVEESEREGE